jgi:hypothetical protein
MGVIRFVICLNGCRATAFDIRTMATKGIDRETAESQTNAPSVVEATSNACLRMTPMNNVCTRHL